MGTQPLQSQTTPLPSICVFVQFVQLCSLANVSEFVVFSCSILDNNVLHEDLKVELENLFVGQNTRQLSIIRVNRTKTRYDQNCLVPHKGILYSMPVKEDSARCEEAFKKCNFSKVVGRRKSKKECMLKHSRTWKYSM